jgi:hypothetical protein
MARSDDQKVNSRPRSWFRESVVANRVERLQSMTFQKRNGPGVGAPEPRLGVCHRGGLNAAI